MQQILVEYKELLAAADAWFTGCLNFAGDQIRCGQGCSGCCHGLFDITFLDALLLREGAAALPATARALVSANARAQVQRLQKKWPTFGPPYLLNGIPEEEWDSPEENSTPCPLLDDSGRCRVYAFRPLICRLHGLPHVDFDGEIFAEDCCTENFPAADPFALSALRGDFRRLFRAEARLLRELAARLGITGGELDTVICGALLLD